MERGDLPKKKEKTSTVDVLIGAIGFVLTIYGFLAMVFPQNYPIGNLSPQISQLFGAILLIAGLALLLSRRE